MGAEWAGDATDRPQPAVVTSSARWRRIWIHRSLLLRVARRYGASPDDAEDAVQDAMIRAAAHSDIDDERLRAWLVTVTKRLCIDRRRQQAREARRCAQAGGGTFAEDTGQRFEDDACDRAQAAWVAARADEVLPARQAQALRLTAAGCDVAQVADRLGVGRRAAESLLARARRTLRATIVAGLGVAGWICRPSLGAANAPGPVALAAAGAGYAAAVATVVTIGVVPGPQPAAPPLALPAAPPATAGEGSPGALEPPHDVTAPLPTTVGDDGPLPVTAPAPSDSAPTTARAPRKARPFTAPPSKPPRSATVPSAAPALQPRPLPKDDVPGSAAEQLRDAPSQPHPVDQPQPVEQPHPAEQPAPARPPHGLPEGGPPERPGAQPLVSGDTSHDSHRHSRAAKRHAANGGVEHGDGVGQ